MLLFVRRYECSTIQTVSKMLRLSASTSTMPNTDDAPDEEFRVLQLIPDRKKFEKKTTTKTYIPPPRTNQMPIDQDWPSVWPGARTFHPESVPLPLRQGYKHNNNPVPDKYGNAELMKIPNFLHLTPPAVRRHCEAIKKFCTEWPKALSTDEDCTKHFPIEMITSDYCYSSPTIRDPLARIVSLQVKLSSLRLDAHAKDKILRLLGNRYNTETGVITITADRCPTRKQNLDYVKYLLTALFHESWRVEPWEAEKTEADMEYYDWDKSRSLKSLVTICKWPAPPIDYDYDTIPHATEYKIAVSDLVNNGQDDLLINKYKEAVKRLLNLDYDKKS